MASANSLGYDETPYPSAPYPYSHPDHLAMVAKLFGIEPASAANCRVLEVGCANGANLIPMALTLPNSHFVGLDLSERQIATGRAVVARLGLTNIALSCQDLSEFAATGATFDYIIAHGVFSWTSPEVRTRLLALCRACLAPVGVAFVSYNVYPGWQQQKSIREWLLRAMRGVADTPVRLQRARQLLSGLRGQLRSPGNESQSAIADTLERLESWTDSYLRHDLLEDSNQPLFFSEFVDQVSVHGLKFFAEADVASMAGTGLSTELAAGATGLGGTLVGREQLLDLLTHRAFRQSLLCHSECSVRERLNEAVTRSAYLICTLRHRPSPGGPQRFESRGGFAVDIAEPAVVEALRQLQNRWPSGAWFGDLISSMPAKLSASDTLATAAAEFEQQQQSLANVLLAGFVERAVELHSIIPAYASCLSERPLASPLARLQAETESLVTNLRHDLVRLEPDARAAIRYLDGTRSLDELRRIIAPVSIDLANRFDVDALLSYFLRNCLLSRHFL